MGNQAPQTDAHSLREILVGYDRFRQHEIAYDWAIKHNRAIDMFGAFAKERHLLLFQSGNESENWIDPILNVVYKMNTLVHVGDDIAKLLQRIEYFNLLFPETSMNFVGFHTMSPTHVYPVFMQPFISNARFATLNEIDEYMDAKGFVKQDEAGKFANEMFVLTDIKPKNVLCANESIIFVIDADITKQ